MSDVFGRIRWWGGLVTMMCVLVTAPLAARGKSLTSFGTLGADLIDRVMAFVGSEIIMWSDVRAVTILGWMDDVDAAAAADDDAAVLTRLINRALILAEVNRFVVPEPDATAVEHRVAGLRARFASPDRFREALEAVGLTEISVARLVRDNQRIDSYLEQRFGSVVQPTEAELARFYRDHEGVYSVGQQPQPFDVVRDQVRRDLQEVRRLKLIADWVVRLQQRANVSRLDGGG